MSRRRSNREIIRSKLGNTSGETGAFDYEPPSARRTMLKNSDDPSSEQEIVEALLRELISEIVRPCDNGKFCLYTKKKDPRTGKRRRLGTHSSKKDAYRQEYAIKMNKR